MRDSRRTRARGRALRGESCPTPEGQVQAHRRCTSESEGSRSLETWRVTQAHRRLQAVGERLRFVLRAGGFRQGKDGGADISEQTGSTCRVDGGQLSECNNETERRAPGCLLSRRRGDCGLRGGGGQGRRTGIHSLFPGWMTRASRVAMSHLLHVVAHAH